jgi:hypothetical protein
MRTYAARIGTIVLLMTLLGGGTRLFAQSTAFTYQGRLNQGGAPVTGLYDFQFIVFDAPTAGSGLGTFPLSATLPVTNGLFTLTMDPGPGVFTGPARWLAIAVRTNGVGSYSNLSPRQLITSAPYAVRSANAALAAGVLPGSITSSSFAPGAIYQVANPSGSISNALSVNGTGLVGIGTGTNAPEAGLHVANGTLLFEPMVLSVVRDGVGGFTNMAGPSALAIQDNLLAVVTDDDEGVTVMDIANPRAPVLLSQLRNGDGGFNKLTRLNAAAIRPNLLVVGALSTNVVTLISLTNPSAPVKLAELEDGVGGWNELSGIYGLAIRGNVLAIAAVADNAVTLADISDPLNPIKRVEIKDGSFGFNSLSGAVAVAISGNLLAIGAFYDNAVTLVDISDPSNPIKLSEIRDGIGGFNNLSNVYKVAFSTNGLLAISGASDNTVTLVDVSNPAVPVLLAELTDGVNGVDALLVPTGVAFSGNWLAAAGAGEGAVTLFDVSNPSSPQKLTVARDAVAGFDFLAVSYVVAFAGTNLVVPGLSDDAVTIIGFTNATVGAVFENRVGIGTTQPRAALDVNGNVIVENAAFFDVNAEKIELGLRSSASGSNAVAIGHEVLASGNFATALGSFTAASGDYATALGYATKAGGLYSFAAGNNTEANGDYSVAMGGFSRAVTNYAVAVGFNNYAAGEYGIAMGYQSSAEGTAAVALGNNVFALGNYSVALGFQTRANTNNSMAVGSRAVVDHPGTFVWADNTGTQFLSSTNNQFLIRASGGVGINTNLTTNVALNVRGNVTVNGTVTATNFSGRFTGNASGLTNTPTQGNYVFVYDTSTQTAASANTFQDVTFDSNGPTNGWARQAGGAFFTNQQAGLYLVEYSAHAENTLAGLSTVSLRAIVNASTEVAGSQSAVEPDTANQSLVLSKSFIVNLASNNTLRLQFAGSTTSNRLIPNQGQGTTRPSISMTIIRIQ